MKQLLAPASAKQMLDERMAILIDIREVKEYAREHIPGTRNIPLSGMMGSIEVESAKSVIFCCRSGNRTAAAAEKLAAAAGGHPYILSGGLEAWKLAGLPVLKDRGRPIEMMRQVQIAAGGLVLVGVALGALLHPGFYALSGLVGAGLLVSGATGSCAMARLLGFAPWNRISGG